MVVNSTAGVRSVRRVATSVPGGTWRTSVGMADSQNVTRRLAAVGGKQPHADQLEELDVVAVGDPVEPVDQLVDHVGERLDERDAGIGHVVVGPLRAALLHDALGVVDEVLEAAVVEVRGAGSGHRATVGSSRDHVEGEHEVAGVVGAAGST